MARRAVVTIGPASSTGSPITLMMRPSISSPTGTMMGAPVSATGVPRTRPSVEVHGDGANRVLAEMLRHFENEAIALIGGLQSIQDFRQVIVEFHVDDSADHLRDVTRGRGGSHCLVLSAVVLVRALRRPR